jgi:broad specificity phosphatase PhoE
MVEWILIRPGATELDEQGRIAGTLDVPLSPLGASEVAALVEPLRDKAIGLIYSADCQAAWETAAALGAALGVRSKRLDGLRNLDHGLWQGKCIDELRRLHPRLYKQWQQHPELVCPPQGETVASVVQRLEAFLPRLLRRHRGQTVALVAPEPLATLVRGYLCDTPPGDLWKACEAHGCWESIVVGSEAVARQ